MSTDGMLAVDGASLAYRIDGQEKAPWLVLSNSLMTDMRLWDPQVAAFGNRFRILRYDHRGHGRSSVPNQDCTFPRLVDDLVALLDHLGIASAAVVGVSMGGITALGLAALYPERVTRVAICDCQAQSSDAGARAWDERIALVREGGIEALVEPTVRRWFSEAAFVRQHLAIDIVRTMIAATPADGFIRAARALQDYDFEAFPAQLRCPALFLAGAADGTLPQTTPEMAQATPNARFQAVPEAGHLLNLDQPERFNEVLSAFLDAPAGRVLRTDV